MAARTFTRGSSPRDFGYAVRHAVSDTHHAYLAEDRRTLLQTSDGGRRWQAAPLPANRDADFYDQGPTDVQFVDPRHGWTITFDGALYRTAGAGSHSAVSDPFGS